MAMDAQAKLCILRVLELQIKLAALVEALCYETMMDPTARAKLLPEAERVHSSLKAAQKTIQG